MYAGRNSPTFPDLYMAKEGLAFDATFLVADVYNKFMPRREFVVAM
jgi:hypothetical protein